MAEYDKIAEQYQEKRKNKTRLDYNRDIEIPAMIKSIGEVKGKTILDMGCGFGDHAKKLSTKKYKKYVGFDISQPLVQSANNQKIPRATFYVGDMSKKLKEKNNTFDLVISSLAIHYIKNIKKLFKEVNRVLKKNGEFILTTQHPIFAILCKKNSQGIKVTKNKDGTRNIHGNYFDESAYDFEMGGELGTLKMFNYTFETLIMTGIQSGFELIEYKDIKPQTKAKKIDPIRYELTTTLPSFILFKFKKK